MKGQKYFFNFLALINQQNSIREQPIYLARQLRSLERRLLYRKGRISLEKHRSGLDDDMLWERIANLHRNLVQLRWSKQGRQLDLFSPTTLGEKIEWLKLNYHNELCIKVTDKLASRDYVVEKTGNRHILNRLHGIYSRAEDIDLGNLPNNYVVKTNRWSGDIVVHTETQPAAESNIIALDKLLVRNHGIKAAEWPYWHIPPKVFVEEFLQDDNYGELVDYKFFCFNGKPELIRVGYGRSIGEQQISYFDINWSLMPFIDAKAPGLSEGKWFPCPKSFEKMLCYAKELSEDLPFVRVDFYDINGECRFGELTLYHESGLNCKFDPPEWNSILGDWLTLPKPIRHPKFAYSTVL